MTQMEVNPNDELWRSMLTGEGPFLESRRKNRRLPGKPKCKACLVPLGGAMGRVMRVLRGLEPSRKNPNFCNVCERFVRTHPGAAEIELSLLFADVRGSTTMAERMGAAEFGRLLNRFYDAASRVVIDTDGLIDKLVGDEIVAIYIPAYGPDHARSAVLAARDILLATGHGDASGPWIPVGAGVHTGTALMGAVGGADVGDFTALGDAVNVTARLSSSAPAAEVLITDDAYAASGLDLGELERRRLALKGREAPVDVRVLRVGPMAGEEAVEHAAAAAK